MEKRNTYFWGAVSHGTQGRNETENWLRIYVSFHVKSTRRALRMFLFPFLKRNNEMRNPLSKFPPISPPNAGKYRHFRPRLHRAVFYFANYAVSTWVFREFRLFFVASEGLWFYIPTSNPPERTTYAKCESALCGRSRRNGTRCLSVSFLET